MNGIDLIYRTAGKLFADKGFGSVSMGEIAEKCKMSKANLTTTSPLKMTFMKKLFLERYKTPQIFLIKLNKLMTPTLKK